MLLEDDSDEDGDDLADALLLVAGEPFATRLKTRIGERRLSIERLRHQANTVVSGEELAEDRSVRGLYRFALEDLERVVRALRVPDKVITRSRHCFSGEELVLVLLRRFKRVDPALELAAETGRSTAAISEGVGWLVEHILRTFPHLIDGRSLRAWSGQFAEFAAAFQRLGIPYPNLIGFLDGKVWGTCRPSRNHRFSFNGHKWMYGTKSQGLTLANGIQPFPFVMPDASRHDSYMLQQSGLEDEMRAICRQLGATYVIGADSAYGIGRYIQPLWGGTCAPLPPHGRRPRATWPAAARHAAAHRVRTSLACARCWSQVRLMPYSVPSTRE